MNVLNRLFAGTLLVPLVVLTLGTDAAHAQSAPAVATEETTQKAKPVAAVDETKLDLEPKAIEIV
jgi:hypothetical protein